jgi:hypothetical protein
MMNAAAQIGCGSRRNISRESFLTREFSKAAQPVVGIFC